MRVFIDKIELGLVMRTYKAVKAVNAKDMDAALRRHADGCWDDECPDYAKSDPRYLLDGCNLLSVCRDRKNVVFWILTTADRSCTGIILPEEY